MLDIQFAKNENILFVGYDLLVDMGSEGVWGKSKVVKEIECREMVYE